MTRPAVGPDPLGASRLRLHDGRDDAGFGEEGLQVAGVAGHLQHDRVRPHRHARDEVGDQRSGVGGHADR